jgi:excisionase family DNA binding protein
MAAPRRIAPPRDLRTVGETAEQLRKCTRTIRRYIVSGQLPAYRVGGAGGTHLLIAQADIDKLLTPIAAGR